MIQAIEVKSCPFCAHDDVQIDEVDMGCFAVICPECECMGPVSRESLAAAIALWNKAHERNLSMDDAVREIKEWDQRGRVST